MSYLVYCILDGRRRTPRREVRFLGYPQASIMVRAAGLAAVVSRTSAADLAPDVPRLLAYAKVVEWYNRERTVIPMRFGCTFGELGEIRGLLENHRGEYQQLLAEFEGRAEMSARVTLEELQSRKRGGIETPVPSLGLLVGNGAGPGTAYLTERSAAYALRNELEKRRDEIRRAISGMAKGTFDRWTSEYRVRGSTGVLAVHFLVPRKGIGKFIESMKRLTPCPDSSLAVTGPWPPYNFVPPPAALLPH
jgi:gas vesicle protein GvpL/GvpF